MRRANTFSKTQPGGPPSLLAQRMSEMDERESHRGRLAQLQNELGSAGESLEMCARAAEKAWEARKVETVTPDLEYGYRLACAEMALVFRAMRSGKQLTPDDFTDCKQQVRDAIDGE